MLIALFRLLSTWPLFVMHGIGALLGWLVYGASPRYRTHLKNNLQRAGFAPVLSQAIAEAGKNILELPFVWCAPPQRIHQAVKLDNWEVVQAALEAQRGIIFLTPHLGCFEIAAQFVATQVPLTVLYRPPRKKILQPLIEGARARSQLRLAPANLTGVRMLLKTLKSGGAIGLLPDQVPQQGEGVWADFFGQPAYTMTLSAKLQQLSQAPIILTYAQRLPQGAGYWLRFMPFEGPLGETPAQQARAINAAMEALIARCPAQYVWSYQRYKTPRGVSAPKENA